MDYRNTPINDLSIASSLISSDILMSSRSVTDSVFSSTQISADTISYDIASKLSGAVSFSPTGTWSFEGDFGTITVPTKTIKQLDDGKHTKSVVNIDYLSSAFFKLFNLLSSEIYVKNHIPSRVGEIVFTTALKSESKMKKYYGENTSWVQIPGRFLWATAKQNDEVAPSLSVSGLRGGQDFVELDINSVPNHTHDFEASSDTRQYSAEFELGEGKEEDSSEIKIVIPSQSPAHDGDEWDRGALKEVSGSWSDVGAETEKVMIYGSGKKLIKVKANSSRNKPHNNVPPFYSVYIWRRTR